MLTVYLTCTEIKTLHAVLCHQGRGLWTDLSFLVENKVPFFITLE